MFKKLVGLLAFNPSLLDELTSYGKLLKKQLPVRRIGLAFIFTGLLIHIIAIIWAPQPSVTSSPNDLLRGGFSSYDDVLSKCYSNTDDYRIELMYFHITCNDLALTTTVSLEPNEKTGHWWVLGQLYYDSPKTQSIEISKRQYWFRPFGSSGRTRLSSKKALHGLTVEQTPFYLLYESGNLVIKSLPQAPTCSNALPLCKQPCITETNDRASCLIDQKLTVKNETTGKENTQGIKAHGGDVLTYTLITTNKEPGDIVYNVKNDVTDLLTAADVISLGGGQLEDGIIEWPAVHMQPGKSLEYNIQLRVKDPLPLTPISLTDPEHFDTTFTNYYGNSTEVALERGFIKTAESIAYHLPLTPNLWGVFFGLIVAFIGYSSYTRNQLLIDEIKLLRQGSNSEK